MNLKKKIGFILQKIGLKQVGIKLDLKVHSIFRDIISYFRFIYIPLLVKYRSRKGVLAINLDSDWLGLGARIVKTIELLMYAENNGLTLYLQFGYQKKKDTFDYFKDLFDVKINNKKATNEIKFTHIRDVGELKLKENYNELLTINLANTLFNKHLQIKKNIINETENFYNINFKNSRILGFHYRGTDKTGEAPKVDLSTVYNLIQNKIESDKYDKLFISTDEESCIEYFTTKNLPIEILWRNDIYRSKDGNQFHRNQSNDMSVINQEALINCLLLSRCDLLIKTASILSDCSKIFNPNLEMLILNEPHSSNLTWWPATELNPKYLINI